MDIRVGDLVQYRYGMWHYAATRTVIEVREHSVFVLGGHEVLRSNVLTLIPMVDLCDTCQWRPCRCDDDY